MSSIGHIPIPGSFQLNSKIPIDPRFLKKTKADLDSIEYPYPGLVVWVENYKNNQPNAVIYVDDTRKFITLAEFVKGDLASQQQRFQVQDEPEVDIDHGLGKIPKVTIIEESGAESEALIIHNLQTFNSCKVIFNTPFTGVITLD